jgi:hypothetical protein
MRRLLVSTLLTGLAVLGTAGTATATEESGPPLGGQETAAVFELVEQVAPQASSVKPQNEPSSQSQSQSDDEPSSQAQSESQSQSDYQSQSEDQPSSPSQESHAHAQGEDGTGQDGGSNLSD